MRSVGVFGTTYEVSRGQFSGGQIAASTIGGTNLWGGAVTAQLDGPGLRSGGPPASEFAPQAVLKQIPNSYHFIMWDAPEAFQTPW